MALAWHHPQQPEVLREEILAERAWRLIQWDDPGKAPVSVPLGTVLESPGAGVLLRSIGTEVYWHGPSLTADKQPRQHNTSGIHCFKLGDDGACPDRDGYRWHQAVVGVVALSGIVQIHKHGYRAERATIQSLMLRWGHVAEADAAAIGEALAERYQCPVTVETKAEYEAAYEAHRAHELERAWDAYCSKYPDGRETLDLVPVAEGVVRDFAAPPGTLMKPERKGRLKVIRFIEVASSRYVLVPLEKFSHAAVEIEVPDDAPEMGGHFARLWRLLREVRGGAWVTRGLTW